MTSAFITGISGFIGKHLTTYLYKLNWRVSGSDLQSAADIPEFYQGDINNHAMLRQAFQETRPDVIFHLAGVIK